MPVESGGTTRGLTAVAGTPTAIAPTGQRIAHSPHDTQASLISGPVAAVGFWIASVGQSCSIENQPFTASNEKLRHGSSGQRKHADGNCSPPGPFRTADRLTADRSPCTSSGGR